MAVVCGAVAPAAPAPPPLALFPRTPLSVGCTAVAGGGGDMFRTTGCSCSRCRCCRRSVNKFVSFPSIHRDALVLTPLKSDRNVFAWLKRKTVGSSYSSFACEMDVKDDVHRGMREQATDVHARTRSSREVLSLSYLLRTMAPRLLPSSRAYLTPCCRHRFSLFECLGVVLALSGLSCNVLSDTVPAFGGTSGGSRCPSRAAPRGRRG